MVQLFCSYAGSAHSDMSFAQATYLTHSELVDGVHRCHGAGCKVPYGPAALHGGPSGADAHVGPRCLASSLPTLSRLAVPAPLCLILPQGIKVKAADKLPRSIPLPVQRNLSGQSI